jgi:hypothetical protein
VADLYADHNIRRDVRDAMRARGHALTITGDLGLGRATDDAQLLVAAEHGLILLTYNHKDFVLLHDAWRRWSTAWGVSPRHVGIIVPKAQWSAERASAEIDRLLAAVASFEDAFYEWHGALGWIHRT